MKKNNKINAIQQIIEIGKLFGANFARGLKYMHSPTLAQKKEINAYVKYKQTKYQKLNKILDSYLSNDKSKSHKKD